MKEREDVGGSVCYICRDWETLHGSLMSYQRHLNDRVETMIVVKHLTTRLCGASRWWSSLGTCAVHRPFPQLIRFLGDRFRIINFKKLPIKSVFIDLHLCQVKEIITRSPLYQLHVNWNILWLVSLILWIKFLSDNTNSFRPILHLITLNIFSPRSPFLRLI